MGGSGERYLLQKRNLQQKTKYLMMQNGAAI